MVVSGLVVLFTGTQLGLLGDVCDLRGHFLFSFFFLFYDNFTYMSNMFFQLLALESMG